MKKFFTILSALLLVLTSVASCDSGKTESPKVKFAAQMSAPLEGVTFDEEAGLLTVPAAALQCSAIKIVNTAGDLEGLTLKAKSADNTWCVARMASSYLSLVIVENKSASQRQTVVTVQAIRDEAVVNTYDLIVIQNGAGNVEPDVPGPGEPTDATAMLQFMIQGQLKSQITSTIVSVTMPYGTDCSNLIAVYEISKGATCNIPSATAQNFTQPVSYIVTSADKTVSTSYTVVVSCAPQSGGGDDYVIEHNPAYKNFDYVEVKGGTFTLGRDPSGKESDKTNAHDVTISDIIVGKYEVTQAEYKIVMGYNPAIVNEDEQYPVHNVTLYEAMLYCNKLSERDGLDKVYSFSDEVWGPDKVELYRATVGRNEYANGWRLPTNAEWEYVAKGGPNHDPYYYPGSDNLDEVAWYDETSLVNDEPHMRCVGLKKPNSLGIYDLAGNIAEFTTEWYWSLDYLSDAPEIDPWGNPNVRPDTGQGTGDNLIIDRGGDYQGYDGHCKVTDWNLLNGNLKNDQYEPGGEFYIERLGFRVYRYKNTRK